MSFSDNVNKLFQNKPSHNRRFIDTDVLERLARTREAHYYYRSIKHVGDRRNFASSFIRILNDFFDLCEDPLAREQVNDSIKALSSIYLHSNDISEMFEKIKSEEPDGYRLIEISHDDDLESVKKKWRNACKKYHPDVGGTKEKQQAINNAYDLVNNMLTLVNNIPTKNCVDDYDEDVSEYTFEGFLKDLFNVYLRITADNYDCINCISLAKRQVKFGLWLAGEGRLKDYSSIIEDIDFLMNEIKSNPGTLKAEYCANQVIMVCNTTVRCDFKRELVGNIKSNLEEWMLKQKRKRKPAKSILVFRSYSQIENAHSLGIINDDKYIKKVSKYIRRIRAEEESFLDIQSYANDPGFILDLGIYPIDLSKKQPKEFVPEPWYFCERFDDLDEDQQVEYLSMLKPPVNLPTIKKYLYQRIAAYCIAVVKNYNSLNWDRIITEINLLSKLGNTCAPFVLELIKYINSLSYNEREKRLEILKSLDSDESKLNSEDKTFSFNINTINLSPCKKKCRIEPTPDYVFFAMLPIERLELFKHTGSYLTEKESNNARNAKTEFNKELDLLKKTSVGKAWLNIICDPKCIKDEDKLVNLKAYAEKIEEISKKYPTNIARYVDFDYVYDRITVTQMKLKDWCGVIESAENFFSIPKQLRTRGCTSSYMENIEKRLGKAKKMLSKM